MSIAICVTDQPLFLLLYDILIRAGYRCERYPTELALLRALPHEGIELVLLEVSQISDEQQELFNWMRKQGGDRIPFLALSIANRSETTTFILNSGADDVIGIPFYDRELIARISALLRRCRREIELRELIIGGFTLSSEDNSVHFRDVPITLTSREFAMAWLLFSNPGKYIPRDTIGTAVWGRDGDIAGRTIEQHIYKLRKKLMLDEKPLVLLRTAYGQGYCLELCYES